MTTSGPRAVIGGLPDPKYRLPDPNTTGTTCSSTAVWVLPSRRSRPLDEGSESIDRGPKPVRRRIAGPREPVLVSQLAPVVRVRDSRVGPVDRIEFPSPKVPRRFLLRLGRLPGDAPTLDELHHVVLPNTATGERHREHVTNATDALAGWCLGQVVVSVPPRLLRRIGNQLEDRLKPGRDIPTRAGDPWDPIGACHSHHRSPIKAPEQDPTRRAIGQSLLGMGGTVSAGGCSGLAGGCGRMHQTSAGHSRADRVGWGYARVAPLGGPAATLAASAHSRDAVPV